MDLKTLGAVGSKALMMVLQDWVSGELAQPVSLQQAILSPSMQLPPPVAHWLSTMGEQSSRMLPRFIPSLLPDIVFPPFPCTYPFLGFAFIHRMSLRETLFLFCFELINRMSPHENPRHPTLPLFAQTFQFSNPYKHYIHQ